MRRRVVDAPARSADEDEIRSGGFRARRGAVTIETPHARHLIRTVDP
jgi:hypothetical protein